MTNITVDRAYFTYEAIVFTTVFTLLFMVTNIFMIDYRNLQSMIASQDAFMILMLAAILIFLYKNARISLSPLRKMFLTLWGLYIGSLFLSMIIAGHFVWTEALILLMVTAILFYRIPGRLVVYLVIGALLSLPSLLLIDHTLNESGATLVLVFTAGLLLMPRTNRAMIFYMLPTFLVLNIITTGRTAIFTYLAIAFLQLAWINLYRTTETQRKWFLGGLGGLAVSILLFFARPLYRFFIGNNMDGGGIDLNDFTSGRYELWATVWHNRQWFGEGHQYFNFTELIHAHNIFFDTLGRYGIIPLILFILVLGVVFLLSMTKYTLGILLYFGAYIFIGLFEYNYLFMFVYFSPIVLLFIFMAYILTFREDMIDVDAAKSGK
ncbi:O-antigen ligase family protein [Salinicoccus roseus]|uniref:O-antigen ligase family protein n=1 Tax=Salinicoccus roseus TaxID=45670 RepID=UPI001EF632EC|nr:O-antigen ligase family protein [Salinicoccus roseus]MCG7333036.1 O-antigen ligase domain-containing protein [Salinicoccus roseus]